MKTNIALTTAVLIVLAVPAFANGHNEAAENEKRPKAATENLNKAPNGLRDGAPGVGPATTKGGNGNNPPSGSLYDPTTTFS